MLLLYISWFIPRVPRVPHNRAPFQTNFRIGQIFTNQDSFAKISPLEKLENSRFAKILNFEFQNKLFFRILTI